jgi:hemerythrin-like domain-containing protein
VDRSRRQLITGISLVGAGALLVGCRNNPAASSATNNETKPDQQASDEAATEISATEDLMREHGILRRALLVYQESAARLKQDSNSVPVDALEKTAQLFRAFGEDYHEKALEETYIFPALKRTQNAASVYADVLLAQHARGREITDYILAQTRGDKLAEASVGPFVTALETFVRMYDHHATIEDTIVFPAWKELVGARELDEIGVKFEEIEEKIFGDDGFEAAQKRMAEIEESLGLANLGMFTAPAPPAH